MTGKFSRRQPTTFQFVDVVVVGVVVVVAVVLSSQAVIIK
jgi:hypothetical protein